MKPILRHLVPSPAMVVACLALAVALGGTGYAAIKLPKNSVGAKQLKRHAVNSAKVKDNALTGADVNEATLSAVPTATSATSATSAANADTLDGVDSSGFVRPGSAEAWHEIGAPGQPPFQNGWMNLGPQVTTAAFLKDPLGVVHLKGQVIGGLSGTTILTLPAGYRPSKIACAATHRGNAIAAVCLFPDGRVMQGLGISTSGLLLDNVTFRVGS